MILPTGAGGSGRVGALFWHFIDVWFWDQSMISLFRVASVCKCKILDIIAYKQMVCFLHTALYVSCATTWEQQFEEQYVRHANNVSFGHWANAAAPAAIWILALQFQPSNEVILPINWICANLMWSRDMQYHCGLVWAGHTESKFKHGFIAYQGSIPNSLWELPHHSCYWVAYNGRLPEPTPHIAERTNGEHYIKITYTYTYTKEDKYTYVQHIYIYICMYTCICKYI